ncbi:MAG: DUF4136 domain-containing protein [Proteobacteria bacterium]|nr:DUF4136 domain-containing protein [Pseudomonadota bacterium]
MNLDNGSIFMVMVDPDLAGQNEAGDDEIPLVWSGGLKGLLGNNSRSDIESGINKAFTQSPYLRVGPAVPSKPGLGEPDAGTN